MRMFMAIASTAGICISIYLSGNEWIAALGAAVWGLNLGSAIYGKG